HRLYGREYTMQAHLAHGAALLRGGQRDAAIQSFNSALALYPSHPLPDLGVALATGATFDLSSIRDPLMRGVAFASCGRLDQAADEPRVGLLLPSSVGGALANIAVALAGKTSVNLNFTTGRDGMAAAIGRCELRTIVTSRKFLAKADLTAPDGAVFLEDILAQ